MAAGTPVERRGRKFCVTPGAVSVSSLGGIQCVFSPRSGIIESHSPPARIPAAVWVLAMRLAAATVPALLTALLFTPAPRAAAADPAKPDPAGAEFFEKKIRPVLTQHCASCHSAEAATNKKLKGNLYLDTRAGVLKGGDSGPALVPGKPAESLLLRSSTTATCRCRRRANCPTRSSRTSRSGSRWAPSIPRGDTATGPKRQIGLTIEEGRKFWAYKLPATPAVPKGSAHPVDAFVLAALEKKGLKPAPEADRAALIRRLYYDLTGLPPAPEEVDAFVNDNPTRRPTRSWSIACWRRRSSASAGAATGSMSPATASPSRSAASSSQRRGATATTCSTPSTATCRSIASSASSLPATSCRPRLPPTAPAS